MTAVDRARRLVSGLALTLRETRKQEGVSVRQLGAELDMPAPVITYIETSRWIPTPEQTQKLTQWLLDHPLLNRDGSAG